MCGNDKRITAPESTEACTSWYTDFQVLPVTSMLYAYFINLLIFITFGGSKE